MEEQTRKQRAAETESGAESGKAYEYEREYPSTAGGRKDRRRGRDRFRGFLPGVLTGILVAVIAVGIIFSVTGKGPGGTAASSGSASGSAVSEETVDKLRVLEQYMDSYYYKSSEITRQDKENGIYKGLFESLGDVYSCYYTPQEYKALVEQTQGVYYGIGAYVSQDVETGACAVSGVIKNSPAEAAGLMEGDIIYKVDGEDMSGLELDEVVSHIRGEEGTKVTVTVIRGGETMEVELTRAKVDTPTVESRMLDDGIGYLQITEFDDVTVGQFTQNLQQLKTQGMKGLIIDLRGNPGGNVTSVCSIAEQLLPEGLIFYMEDKNGSRTEYTCKGADFDLPLVVLVNEYSASASEILSGAIKDAGIGKLVGKTTFGKGIVQNLIALDDGSAIKLTVANYYTRGGNDIHLKGIEPDVEIELDTDAYLEDKTDTQLNKAVEVMLEEMGKKQ